MITFFWPWLLLLLPLPLLIRKLFDSFLEKVLENESQKNTEKFTITEALKLPDYNELVAITAEEQTAGLWNNRLIIPWLIWVLLVISASQPLWMDARKMI